MAVALGGIALVAALALQFAARRYVPWIYWLAVAMVGVFGTMAADVLHVGLGVPYLVSTAFFAVTLAVVFAAWSASEKTLSIHSIFSARREAFYWAAVMTTFALGTAAGDMTAVTLKLGYFASGVMFVVVVSIPAVAHRYFGLNAILAFWLPTSRPGPWEHRSRTGWAYPAPGVGLTWVPVPSAWPWRSSSLASLCT